MFELRKILFADKQNFGHVNICVLRLLCGTLPDDQIQPEMMGIYIHERKKTEAEEGERRKKVNHRDFSLSSFGILTLFDVK